MHIQWDRAVSTQRQPLYARVTLLMEPVVPSNFFLSVATCMPITTDSVAYWGYHLAGVPSGVGL